MGRRGDADGVDAGDARVLEQRRGTAGVVRTPANFVGGSSAAEMKGKESLRDAPGQGDGGGRVVGLGSPLLSPEIEEDGGGDTSSNEQFEQPWGEFDVAVVGK